MPFQFGFRTTDPRPSAALFTKAEDGGESDKGDSTAIAPTRGRGAGFGFAEFFPADRDPARLHFRLLGNDDLEHPVLQLGFHVVSVGAVRERERAAEAAVRALAGVVGVALFVLFLFTLPRNRQAISGQRNLQVLFAYAR